MKYLVIVIAILSFSCGKDEMPFGVRTPIHIAVENDAEVGLEGRAIYITNPHTSDPFSKRYVITYGFYSYEMAETPYCEEGRTFNLEIREGVPTLFKPSSKLLFKKSISCDPRLSGEAIEVLIYTPKDFRDGDPRLLDHFDVKYLGSEGFYEFFF